MTENDYQSLLTDVEISQEEINSEKKKFIRELNDGLGDSIMNYLNNPPKKNKKLEKKLRKARKKEILKENLKKIFYS